MTDSEITADNYGNENSCVTDIRADALSFTNTLTRFNVDEAAGNHGDVRFSARDSICLTDVSIHADSDGIGNGADIMIQGRDVSVEGALISCISYEIGNTGNISIMADSLSFSSGEKHQGSRLLIRRPIWAWEGPEMSP